MVAVIRVVDIMVDTVAGVIMVAVGVTAAVGGMVEVGATVVFILLFTMVAKFAAAKSLSVLMLTAKLLAHAVFAESDTNR